MESRTVTVTETVVEVKVEEGLEAEVALLGWVATSGLGWSRLASAGAVFER